MYFGNVFYLDGESYECNFVIRRRQLHLIPVYNLKWSDLLKATSDDYSYTVLELKNIVTIGTACLEIPLFGVRSGEVADDQVACAQLGDILAELSTRNQSTFTRSMAEDIKTVQWDGSMIDPGLGDGFSEGIKSMKFENTYHRI